MEEKVVLSNKRNLGNKQMVVDCRFMVSNGNEIGKVLSVSATPFVTNTDTYPSSIKYSGKVNFKLIYLTEDGRVLSINNMTDFDDTIDVDNLTEDAFGMVHFKVVDVTTPSVKTNEVKVACVMEASISVEGRNYFDNVSIEDGVFCKKGSMDNYELTCHFKDAFELNEEIRINGELNNVLTLDADLCVKDVYTGNGFVVVSGQIFCCVVYDTEEAVFRSYKQTIDFKQEIAIDEATIDSKVCMNLSLQHNLIKMSIVQEDGYNAINLELPIIAYGTVYNKNTIEVVEDVYSESEIIDTKLKDLNIVEQVHSYCIEDYVRENVSIDEVEGASLLGFSGANVVVSSCYIEGDKLNIEGVISGTVIFDTNSQITSIIAEVPFIIVNTKPEYSQLEDIDVLAGLCDFDVTIKSSTQMELTAKLNFYVTGTRHRLIKAIDTIDIVAKRPERDCAIEIVITGEQRTLWELGKSLGVSAEQLLIQNPSLVEPISAGQKVIVYYPYSV